MGQGTFLSEVIGLTDLKCTFLIKSSIKLFCMMCICRHNVLMNTSCMAPELLQLFANMPPLLGQ